MTAGSSMKPRPNATSVFNTVACTRRSSASNWSVTSCIARAWMRSRIKASWERSARPAARRSAKRARAAILPMVRAYRPYSRSELKGGGGARSRVPTTNTANCATAMTGTTMSAVLVAARNPINPTAIVTIDAPSCQPPPEGRARKKMRDHANSIAMLRACATPCQRLGSRAVRAVLTSRSQVRVMLIRYQPASSPPRPLVNSARMNKPCQMTDSTMSP